MSQQFGRTRWKRFAFFLVPSIAAAAATAIGLAQGALAASFFISGKEFKISADSLTGEGFSLYGTVDVTRKRTPVPVVVAGFKSATIQGLCQSVVVPVPVLGPYTLTVTGGRRPTTAKNLFIDMATLEADQANFRRIDIGIAAGSLTVGEVSPGDRDSRFFDPNGFAQQARSATLTDLRLTAVATSAGTFDVPGLKLSLDKGKDECF
ncbi:cholesterol esterase [Streptomyces sp. ISL-1]|uniref:DUF6230 family protein n=1 Tax=Streptomyces sp. ISL-1 TaxID=2817657 RepID=UPI001BE76468|nr:DUF6230 family protein [Streptomyces sp. ISL-1]MBT2392058.1 cholesterol esterase [Streptomyces sp. ISL-1]